MVTISESTKNTNKVIEIYQKPLENSSSGDMKTQQRVPMTVQLGKTDGNLIAPLKEASSREEKSQSSSQSKTEKKSSSGEAEERGKISIVGMGGVGGTRIENNSSVTLKFGDVGEKSQSSSQSETEKKSSSGEAEERGKISIVGMGGVGETIIKSDAPVTITFGNIKV